MNGKPRRTRPRRARARRNGRSTGAEGDGRNRTGSSFVRSRACSSRRSPGPSKYAKKEPRHQKSRDDGGGGDDLRLRSAPTPGPVLSASTRPPIECLRSSPSRARIGRRPPRTAAGTCRARSGFHACAFDHDDTAGAESRGEALGRCGFRHLVRPSRDDEDGRRYAARKIRLVKPSHESERGMEPANRQAGREEVRSCRDEFRRWVEPIGVGRPDISFELPEPSF